MVTAGMPAVTQACACSQAVRRTHEGGVGRCRLSPPHCFQPVSVRQPKVEKNDVEFGFLETSLRLTHRCHLSQLRAARSLVVEHLSKQAGVARIILDQEKPLDCVETHAVCVRFGSLTFVSQKSLMLLTRLSKAFN